MVQSGALRAQPRAMAEKRNGQHLGKAGRGWASRQGRVKGTSQGLTWTTGGDICPNKGQTFLREKKMTRLDFGTLGLRSMSDGQGGTSEGVTGPSVTPPAVTGTWLILQTAGASWMHVSRVNHLSLLRGEMPTALGFRYFLGPGERMERSEGWLPHRALHTRGDFLWVGGPASLLPGKVRMCTVPSGVCSASDPHDARCCLHPHLENLSHGTGCAFHKALGDIQDQLSREKTDCDRKLRL